MAFGDLTEETIQELRGLVQFCEQHGHLEVAGEITSLITDLEDRIERQTDELEKLVAEIENQIAS